jgi:ankyrin repeat protein
MHYVGNLSVDPEVVRYLIDKGASVNSQAKYGHTPLSSVPHGSRDSRIRYQIFRLLLERGANPNSADSSGYTPLHKAVGNCEPEEVKLLLDYGANISINRCGKRQGNPYWGFAPIHYAIFAARYAAGRVPVIRLLVDSGADTTLQANSSRLYTPRSLLVDSLTEAERGRQHGGPNAAWFEKWLEELRAIESYFDELGL